MPVYSWLPPEFIQCGCRVYDHTHIQTCSWNNRVKTFFSHKTVWDKEAELGTLLGSKFACYNFVSSKRNKEILPYHDRSEWYRGTLSSEKIKTPSYFSRHLYPQKCSMQQLSGQYFAALMYWMVCFLLHPFPGKQWNLGMSHSRTVNNLARNQPST